MLDPTDPTENITTLHRDLIYQADKISYDWIVNKYSTSKESISTDCSDEFAEIIREIDQKILELRRFRKSVESDSSDSEESSEYSELQIGTEFSDSSDDERSISYEFSSSEEEELVKPIIQKTYKIIDNYSSYSASDDFSSEDFSDDSDISDNNTPIISPKPLSQFIVPPCNEFPSTPFPSLTNSPIPLHIPLHIPTPPPLPIHLIPKDLRPDPRDGWDTCSISIESESVSHSLPAISDFDEESVSSSLPALSDSDEESVSSSLSDSCSDMPPLISDSDEEIIKKSIRSNHTSWTLPKEKSSINVGINNTFFNPNIWHMDVSMYPVVIQWFESLWIEEPDIMVRFISLVTLYFNIIMLVDEKYLDLEKDNTYKALADYYLTESERQILNSAPNYPSDKKLINDVSENVLQFLVDSVSDLCRYAIRETEDAAFIGRCMNYLNTIDLLMNQFSEMV